MKSILFIYPDTSEEGHHYGFDISMLPRKGEVIRNKGKHFIVDEIIWDVVELHVQVKLIPYPF